MNNFDDYIAENASQKVIATVWHPEKGNDKHEDITIHVTGAGGGKAALLDAIEKLDRRGYDIQGLRFA